MSELATQIAVLETQMKNIANKVDEGFKANSEEHKEMMQAFQDAIDKKAGRWVEKVLIWVGGIIGAAVLTAIMSLILTK